jgi:hypothetical protein
MKAVVSLDERRSWAKPRFLYRCSALAVIDGEILNARVF